MPKGMPIDPLHLNPDEAVRKAALMLAHLIAVQVVREGCASSMEVWKNAEAPEEGS